MKARLLEAGVRVALLCLFFVFFAAPARAEVESATPGAFVIVNTTEVAATQDATWDALLRIGAWWSSAHSYSGDARRMTLEPSAGGCFCERWDGQSVEHARVVAVYEAEGESTLRLLGALGPLQAMGVSGVLNFSVAPAPRDAQKAILRMSYLVSGDPGLLLDQAAEPVNGVLMEQIGRLARYAETGTPD